MSELSDIQKLIRLKRYEQPPEGYFDDFLFEFQRRQRAEMLKRPLWQIVWERANLWLESFRVPAIAYASILVAAIGVTGVIVNSQSNVVSSGSLASASGPVVLFAVRSRRPGGAGLHRRKHSSQLRSRETAGKL